MDIVDILKNKYSAMTTKQKKLADFMLNDPHIMCFITLKELSIATKVTEVTILNACTAWGFNNFNDLKYEFRKYNSNESKEKSQQENIYSSVVVPSYELSDKNKLLTEICREEYALMSVIVNKLDVEKLFEAAKIILENKIIVVCGRGISYQVAEFITMRLATLGISSISVDTENSDSIYSVLSLLSKNMLVLAISFPDYYYMTNKFVEYAALKKATIIGITDNNSSEVAKKSDIHLISPSHTRLFINTLSAPMMIANLLTSAVSIEKSGRYKLGDSVIDDFTKIFSKHDNKEEENVYI